MDTQAGADMVQDTNEWDVGDQEISDYLNDKLSIDPIVEPAASSADNYCSVATAAKILGKSGRQVQRLLKAGQLKGYKTIGRGGPQWLVDCNDLTAYNGSSAVENSPLDQLTIFASKFELILSELEMLKQKVECFESDLVRLDKTESMIAELHDVVSGLKDEVQAASAVPVRTPMAVADATVKAEPKQETSVSISESDVKPSWWHRAFALK